MARLPRQRPSADERRAKRVEAILGMVSAVVVLGILGVLVFAATRQTDAPADLAVRELATTAAGSGQLRFEVFNRGERAAASVTVALSLRDGAGEIVDKRTALLEFVPAHSQAGGAFMLDDRDRSLARQLSVESYLDP